jgi:hypothetical protein
MNFNIKKITLLTSAALVILSLAACGGGGSVDVGYSGDNSPPPPAYVNTTYYDFNYLQNVMGLPVGQASIVDYGPNETGGSVTYGLPSNQITSDFTVDSSGNNYWGNNVLTALQFDRNPIDGYAPAVVMVCNSVPNSGVGPNNQTSTDVLVTSTATQLFSGAQLAGIAFGQYYENCVQGGSIPSSPSGDVLIFNVDGSATITTAAGGSQVSGTITLSPSQVSAALQGAPIQISTDTFGAMTTLTAYQYTTLSGATSYAIVEHGSNVSSNLSGGYVAVWYP